MIDDDHSLPPDAPELRQLTHPFRWFIAVLNAALVALVILGAPSWLIAWQAVHISVVIVFQSIFLLYMLRRAAWRAS